MFILLFFLVKSGAGCVRFNHCTLIESGTADGKDIPELVPLHGNKERIDQETETHKSLEFFSQNHYHKSYFSGLLLSSPNSSIQSKKSWEQDFDISLTPYEWDMILMCSISQSK